MTTTTWILFGLCALLVAALAFALRQQRLTHERLERLVELDAMHTTQAEELADLATHWEKRFWSLFRASEQLIGERDAIKDIYRDSVNKHLEGQALLSASLTKTRARAVALVNIVNEERARRAAMIEQIGKRQSRSDREGAVATVRALCQEAPTRTITDDELEALDAFPRGKVEEYFEQIKAWSKQAVDEDKRLERQLRGDRAKWDEHYRALAASARGGPPPRTDPPEPKPSPPSDSLGGLTVQEVVPL